MSPLIPANPSFFCDSKRDKAITLNLKSLEAVLSRHSEDVQKTDLISFRGKAIFVKSLLSPEKPLL